MCVKKDGNDCIMWSTQCGGTIWEIRVHECMEACVGGKYIWPVRGIDKENQ